MALEPRFNFDFNTTVIDGAADIKAQRQMQNIASKESQRSTVGDFINVVGKGAEVYNSIQAAEDVGQGAKAQEHYTALINSDGYLQANDTAKFDMLQNVLNLAPEQGEAYATTMAGIMSSNMSKVYKGMNNERVEGAVLLSYTDSIRYAEQSGKNHDDWVNDYVARFPYLKDSKKELNMAVLGGMLLDGVSEIQDARTPEELNEALLNIKDRTKGLDTPHIFGSKNADMVSYLNRMRKTYGQAVTAKNKEFKATALTRIETSKDTNNPNSLQKYLIPLTLEDFVIAHGDKAPQEYQKYKRKYEEHEGARDFSETFNAETGTDQNGLSTLQKKVANEDITYRLVGALKFNQLHVQDKIILNQGSTDASRLDGIRQSIMSNLGNKDETADTLRQAMELRSKNPAAFNVLFSNLKERTQILGMNALSKTLGKTPYETWMYMKTNPQITADKLDSSTMGELIDIYEGDEPIPMKADIQAMYKLSVGYGVEHADIMVVIKDYIKSKPYELKLEEEYGSEVAKYMQADVDKFSSLNGASKVFVDPVTGVIKVEGPAGTITKMIDKQGLLLHSMDLDRIAKYNDEHWARVALEKKMDTASTWVGRFFSQTKKRDADEEAQYAANRVSNFVSLKDGKGKAPKETILNKPGVMDKITLFTPVKRDGKSPHIMKEYFGPNFVKNLKNTDWKIKEKKVQKDGPYAKGKGDN